MSVQPGWYQDPEGPPGRARYWDGSSWGPRQDGDGPGGAGERGRPAWLVPAVVAVVAAVLVGLGYLVLPGLLAPDDDPIVDPTATAEPTAPETGGTGAETEGPASTTGVGELNCAAAMSNNFDRQPEFRVAGIVVPYPADDKDWGFRFDSSQWTWINDLHAWGTIAIPPEGENWAAGIVAGRLEAANGFGDVEGAAAAVVQCLTTYGPFNTGEEMQVAASEAVTVDGMPGWRMEMAYPEEGAYPATTIRMLVLDAGQEGNLALVIGFNPAGHEASEQVVVDALERTTGQ